MFATIRSSFSEESGNPGEEECDEDPTGDLEATEGVGNPGVGASGAVGGPLGGLSGGERAGKRVVERVQDRVEAARSILQFVTGRCAGDWGRGLAWGRRCLPGRLVGGSGCEDGC